MTAKEKAKRMIANYRSVNFITGNNSKMIACYNDCKQCALIAVDEIIKEIDDCDTEYCVATRETADETTLIVLRDRIKYWQEVKKEIEKL